MATATHFQSNCGICLQPYKRPKLLSCFHSYCEACLSSHISKAKPDSKFQCPLCRTDINIPEGGAASFQTNFYIETKEEENEEERESEEIGSLCENCDDEPKSKATSYCEVCEQKICDVCTQLHKKLKITREHELTSLKVVKTKTFDKPKCFKHESSVVNGYCLTCEKFVCPSCEDAVHDLHKIEPIDVAAKIKRNILKKEWIASERFCSNERVLKIISKRESTIEEMEKKAKEDLQERAVEIKIKIDAGVKKLEDDIMTICESEKEKLKQVKADIDSTNDKQRTLKKWITSASDAEVLRDCNRILFEVKEVNTSSPMNIADTKIVRFKQTCEEFVWENIGEVVTKNKKSSFIKMEIISAFCTPEFGDIKCIIQSQQGEVWISEAGTRGLTVFNERGSEHKKMLEQFEIASVAIGNDGILFISVANEKSIYKISENSKATKYCTLSSIPGDLAVFDNGNVAVCCNKPPKLMIIDETGKVIRQYAPRGSMFRTLLHVSVCKFTDILALCAQDITSNISTSTGEFGEAVGTLQQAVENPRPTTSVKNPKSGPTTAPFGFVTPVSTLQQATSFQEPFNLKGIKGNIFLFDQKGNMMSKSERQVYDLIFDHHGHLLVSLDQGNIDILDNKGNILACLRPNEGDFLSGKIAIVSFSQLWIGQSGRINVFKYPDISMLHG